MRMDHTNGRYRIDMDYNSDEQVTLQYLTVNSEVLGDLEFKKNSVFYGLLGCFHPREILKDDDKMNIMHMYCTTPDNFMALQEYLSTVNLDEPDSITQTLLGRVLYYPDVHRMKLIKGAGGVQTIIFKVM